jgi:hypothetical protein
VFRGGECTSSHGTLRNGRTQRVSHLERCHDGRIRGNKSARFKHAAVCFRQVADDNSPIFQVPPNRQEREKCNAPKQRYTPKIEDNVLCARRIDERQHFVTESVRCICVEKLIREDVNYKNVFMDRAYCIF